MTSGRKLNMTVYGFSTDPIFIDPTFWGYETVNRRTYFASFYVVHVGIFYA